MIESTDALNKQAIEYATQGLYKEAIACFKRAISLSKQNYLFWYNLGITYRDCGNLEAACPVLRQACLLTDSDPEVYEAYAHVLLLAKKHYNALEVICEALELFPLNAKLWNNAGVVNFQVSNFEDAADAFEQALTINPYYSDALYNLRDAYTELGNIAGAEECAKRLKDLPEPNGAYYA